MITDRLFVEVICRERPISGKWGRVYNLLLLGEKLGLTQRNRRLGKGKRWI